MGTAAEGEPEEFKYDAKEERVKAEVERLLGDPALEDLQLREKLEALARCMAFPGLTWLWGPELYRRHRVLFRPFILSHFSSWSVRGPFRGWKAVAWKGEVTRRCEPWMKECDAREDMELFDRLWSWKHAFEANFALRRNKLLRSRLLSRFEEAETPAKRARTLENFSLWFDLGETTACQLFRIDPKASASFLRQRIPVSYWSGDKRVLWSDLLALAEAEGQESLAREIYRRTVPFKMWRADLERFCREIADPEALNETLKEHHPRGYLKQIGEVFHGLLQKRGRDVLPYVLSHLRNVQSGWLFQGAYKDIVRLAGEREWWDLWSATVRIAGTGPQYNEAVRNLLQDSVPEAEARARLAMLAGVSREYDWGGFSAVMVKPLEDRVAVELYEKYPDLVRRAFRPNIESVVWRKQPRFIDTLIRAGDEDLIDFSASRLATRAFAWGNRGMKEAEALADYYETLKGDPVRFARRACGILTQVPAFTIWNYRQLITNNRLARLLFERSPGEFLAAGPGLQDLVEGQEIHVMSLAYRLLGMDDPRAREMAVANVDILLGTLLRPLRRRTRLQAFGALLNAAATEENAARILTKAREAMDLPDKLYPKEELVGLMGRIIHRWPRLRGETESPVVYRAA